MAPLLNLHPVDLHQKAISLGSRGHGQMFSFNFLYPYLL